MVTYDIQLKSFDKLDQLSAQLIVPLRDAAVVLANQIRARVKAGVSPSGGMWTPLGTYTTSGRGKDDSKRWWIGPKQPQPPGYLRKLTQGQWQGWAIYENYERYLELIPNKKRRDWDNSGKLWQSLGVRAMAANRVKISFYGSRGKGIPQAAVAYLAGKKERVSVLQYNDAEREQIVQTIKADIDEEFARRIGEAVQAGRSSRPAGGGRRRSSTLLGV